MKWIVPALVSFLMLVSSVSAYSLDIEGPASQHSGRPITINLSTDLPAGTSIDVVYYRSDQKSTIISTRTIVVQEARKNFTLSFSTSDLKGGQYTIDARPDTGTELRTGSVTALVVEVIDRSDELTVTSPRNQTLTNALVIEGSIEGIGDSGVKIDVHGPGGLIFGPDWIATQSTGRSGEGTFSKTIPVTQAGTYEVRFSDSRGSLGSDIGTVVFNVIDVPTIAIPTQTSSAVRTTRIPTPVAAQAVVPAESPLSAWAGMAALGIAILAVGVLRK